MTFPSDSKGPFNVVTTIIQPEEEEPAGSEPLKKRKREAETTGSPDEEKAEHSSNVFHSDSDASSGNTSDGESDCEALELMERYESNADVTIYLFTLSQWFRQRSAKWMES